MQRACVTCHLCDPTFWLLTWTAGDASGTVGGSRPSVVRKEGIASMTSTLYLMRPPTLCNCSSKQPSSNTWDTPRQLLNPGRPGACVIGGLPSAPCSSFAASLPTSPPACQHPFVHAFLPMVPWSLYLYKPLTKRSWKEAEGVQVRRHEKVPHRPYIKDGMVPDVARPV